MVMSLFNWLKKNYAVVQLKNCASRRNHARCAMHGLYGVPTAVETSAMDGTSCQCAELARFGQLQVERRTNLQVVHGPANETITGRCEQPGPANRRLGRLNQQALSVQVEAKRWWSLVIAWRKQ